VAHLHCVVKYSERFNQSIQDIDLYSKKKATYFGWNSQPSSGMKHDNIKRGFANAILDKRSHALPKKRRYGMKDIRKFWNV
jgi:hypothetical protein